MKKLIVLLAVLLIPVGYAHSASLATTVVSGSGLEIHADSDTGGLIGKLSTGVSAVFVYPNTGANYSVATGHLKGTKAYGSASGDTKLYSVDKTADVVLTDVLTNKAFDTSGTGWTEL